MIEALGDTPDKFEGLSTEQREMLETIDEEGLREHTGLGMLLSAEFGELEESVYQSVCKMIAPDIAAPDPDTFVAEYLMAPDDSPARHTLIEIFSSGPNPNKKLARLLNEMEKFLAANS